MSKNQTLNQCVWNGCVNGGTCIKDPNKRTDEFFCACAELFSGSRCEESFFYIIVTILLKAVL